MGAFGGEIPKSWQKFSGFDVKESERCNFCFEIMKSLIFDVTIHCGVWLLTVLERDKVAFAL